MGSVFEEICRQYLWKLLLDGRCAVNFRNIGRWWGTNLKTKTQEEIDIMGANKNSAPFAECNWTNEKVDLGVLETLVERSEPFAYKKKHFYLFAKTRFTKGCMDKAAEMGYVTLVTYGNAKSINLKGRQGGFTGSGTQGSIRGVNDQLQGRSAVHDKLPHGFNNLLRRAIQGNSVRYNLH